MFITLAHKYAAKRGINKAHSATKYHVQINKSEGLETLTNQQQQLCKIITQYRVSPWDPPQTYTVPRTACTVKKSPGCDIGVKRSMTLASHKLFPMTPIAEFGVYYTDGFHDNLYTQKTVQSQ